MGQAKRVVHHGARSAQAVEQVLEVDLLVQTGLSELKLKIIFVVSMLPDTEFVTDLVIMWCPKLGRKQRQDK